MIGSVAKIVIALIGLAQCTTPPPCPSEIYCHGPLLHTIQTSKIYEDSKTFVDMKLKSPPNETMEKFLEFMQNNGPNPSRELVKGFVNENFEAPGKEFEDWVPQDWTENPSFLNKIKDKDYKRFAMKLNEVWRELGRKMKAEVREKNELYSIIWVPNPVIVPGGRFREFYYWDSYWIVQGLLQSEMFHTVKGMLSNFAYIVDNYGHIPNGGRVYYLGRSQPPLFVPMVLSYLEHTQDLQFVKDHLETFDKEFDYWMDKHSHTIVKNNENYTMFTYFENTSGPRPESYSEDMESAKQFENDDQKATFFKELKSAAESGWDFSSRWFIQNATNKGNLTSIKTSFIVPVDLNAMIYWNAMILSEWHRTFGSESRSIRYKQVAEDLLIAVEKVLWHEEVGSWLDYDMLNEVKRDYFYPSNLVPLWTNCYDKGKTTDITNRVLKYLGTGSIIFPGGVPASQEHTGEQWDYPNAWPPLQHMMIVGLNKTGEANAQRLAYELADRWVRSNYKAYNETESMYEKYDATILGGHGGGGEYEVQLGFGWSNGIVLDLLAKFEHLQYLTFEEQEEPTKPAPYTIHEDVTPSDAKTHRNGPLMTGFIALIVTLAASFIG